MPGRRGKQEPYSEQYEVAAGVVRVNGIDGKRVYSGSFDVTRGVIQGDIIPPVLFILALDQLIQTRDVHGTGFNCDNIFTLRVLGYADDAALIEPRVDDMTTRLTVLADASKAEADMQVSMPKTYTQHVFKREDVIQVSAEEAKEVQQQFKHECEYCERKFQSARAMNIHKSSCMYAYTATAEEYEVENIVGVFGWRSNRWFLVKWVGYKESEWERAHILLQDGCNDAIRQFWLDHGLSPCKEYYDDPHGKHRCDICAKSFKRDQDLKAHRTRSGHSVDKKFAPSTAAVSAVRLQKRKEQQDSLPKVKWGDVPADNC